MAEEAPCFNWPRDVDKPRRMRLAIISYYVRAVTKRKMRNRFCYFGLRSCAGHLPLIGCKLPAKLQKLVV